MRTIELTYKGHGLFATRRKWVLRKGQKIRAYLSTPISDATRGAMKISPRLAKRLLDPELGAWNS